jgi:hypothetical protein
VNFGPCCGTEKSQSWRAIRCGWMDGHMRKTMQMIMINPRLTIDNFLSSFTLIHFSYSMAGLFFQVLDDSAFSFRLQTSSRIYSEVVYPSPKSKRVLHRRIRKTGQADL